MRTGGNRGKTHRGGFQQQGESSLPDRPAPIVYICGTDTGVGKTLLTCLLVEWFLSRGVNALAIKPFVSGGLHDARILGRIQRGMVSLDEISPYRYQLPLAPAIAAELEGRCVRLPAAVSHVKHMQTRCGCLLLEGSGGLMSPLGKGFSALEIIQKVPMHVIVVARNRLGALNHVRLTLRALELSQAESMRVVLMNRASDGALVQKLNAITLRKLLNCDVSVVPDLGGNACGIGRIKAHAKILQKTLAGLVSSDTVTSLLGAAVVKAVLEKTRNGALTSDGGKVKST